MAWVRIDDQFPEHPKIEEVGPLGMAMQVAALCYANRYLTDGKLPSRTVAKFMPTVSFDPETGDPVTWRDIASLLVEAGIWDEVEGGYQIHDYHEYQPSKAEVEETRKKRAEAGRKGGKANGKQSAKQNESNELSKTASKTEAKSNPVPKPGPVPNTQEQKNTTRPTSWPEESVPHKLASRLREAILRRDPQTKVPDPDSRAFASWCTEADRMIRLDERDPDEALSLIDWCQRDEFWSANILSMDKFRKQYDKLKRKAEARASPSPRRNPRESAAKRLLRQEGVI